jgi:hypothetical protein
MLEAFSQEEMFVIPSQIDFKAFGRRVVLGKDAHGNPYTNGCTGKHVIVREGRFGGISSTRSSNIS